MNCDESYKDCVAARQARVREAIHTAEPWETDEKLAEKAGVSRHTVLRARSQLVAPATDCNREPKPLLKLRDMYKDNVAYWTQRKVKAVVAALEECNREQLAYLFSEVLPVYSLNLRAGNVK